jgi:two-component system, NtrC family, response regulator HydG
MSAIHHHLVGDSPPMKDLVGLIEKAARTDATVLIRGESGTGKELVAQAIHANSARSHGRFVALNCAALTESLVESELYGHEKGAFTGAVTQRKGEFELASGGTLFLDEVGEMTPAIQSKLLRALQEREIKRVGGSGTIQVSIRIIAATNRNLETDFRKDLYYRLSVLPIFTPALRDRREDIPVLARRFAAISAPNPAAWFVESPAKWKECCNATIGRAMFASFKMRWNSRSPWVPASLWFPRTLHVCRWTYARVRAWIYRRFPLL